MDAHSQPPGVSGPLGRVRVNALLVSLLAVFGLADLAVTPPFQAADEDRHFLRAYHISEGSLLGVKMIRPGGGGVESGGYLPAHVAADIRLFEDQRFQPKRKTSPAALREKYLAGGRLGFGRKKVFTQFSNTVVYPPVPYLPQAAAIIAAKGLGLRTAGALYLARLFNLAAALSLVWYALAQLGFSHKLRLAAFMLAGLPMSVFQFASASGDAVTIALGLAVLASACRLRRSWDEGSFRMLLFLSLLLSLCRLPYFLLALSAVPAVLGRPRGRLARLLALLAATAGPALAWNVQIAPLLVPLRTGVEPVAQLRFFLDHPWRVTLKIIQRFARESFYLDSFIGRLGWMDTDIGPRLRWGFMSLLLLSGFSGWREERDREGTGGAAVNLAFFLFLCYVIALSQYLAWNRVGAITMQGLQGRYFLPAAGLVVFSLPSLVRFGRRAAGIHLAAVLVVWTALSAGVLAVIRARYWG